MKTEFFIKEQGWVSFCWFWEKFSKERSFIFNRHLHASLQETAVLCALIRDLYVVRLPGGTSCDQLDVVVGDQHTQCVPASCQTCHA